MIQILSNVILLEFTLFLYVGLPLISQMVDNIYCIDEDIYPVCTVYVFYFIYYFIIILSYFILYQPRTFKNGLFYS